MTTPFFAYLGALKALAAIVVAAVSTWIVTVYARRRMRRALGRTPSETELASINAWMNVVEEERTENKPPSPMPQ